MDLKTLALAVDREVYRPPSERGVAARLFGVVMDDQAHRPPVIRLLQTGDARRVLRRFSAPPGLTAVALAVAGWRAPMEADGSMPCSPSQHPLRQRIHSTSLVAGDCELVTVLRTAGHELGGEVEVLLGGVGIVPDLLKGCWRRSLEREAGRSDDDGVPWRLASLPPIPHEVT